MEAEVTAMTAIFRLPNLTIFNDSFHVLGLAIRGIMYLLIFLIISVGNQPALSMGVDQSMIKQVIIAEAQRSDFVSPAIALAVAEAESSFRPDAVSHKGAIGVMQIMPRTARLEFGVSRQALFDPYTNIRIGIRFLDQLAHRYKGRMHFALSHYNGGSAVGAWPHSRVLPYTRNYVENVLDKARKYYAALKDGRYQNQRQSTYKPTLKELSKTQTGLVEKNDIEGLEDMKIWLEIITHMRNRHPSGKTIKGSALSLKMTTNSHNFQKRLGEKF